MQDFQAAWKQLAHTKAIQDFHVVQRAILKAIKSKSQVDKKVIAESIIQSAFTPITNARKLANGRQPYDSVMYAARRAKVAKISVKWERAGLKHRKVEEVVGYRDILGVNALTILTPDEVKLFDELAEEMCGVQPKPKKYSYIFVNKQLSTEQQAVQGMHVSMELGAMIGKDVKGLYFQVCGVDGKDGLKQVRSHLASNGFQYHLFREPDLGNSVTAVATFPIDDKNRSALLDFELLKFEQEVGGCAI